jgi:hypothetical protein
MPQDSGMKGDISSAQAPWMAAVPTLVSFRAAFTPGLMSHDIPDYSLVRGTMLRIFRADVSQK